MVKVITRVIGRILPDSYPICTGRQQSDRFQMGNMGMAVITISAGAVRSIKDMTVGRAFSVTVVLSRSFGMQPDTLIKRI